MRYYIHYNGPYQIINYGTIYKTLASAKKALRESVKESKAAAKRLYGCTTYVHWSENREYVDITFAKDPRSRLWESIQILVCNPLIPCVEVKE